MKQVFTLLVCLLMIVTVFAACDKEEPPHEHTFDSTWLYDETRHWHAATCEHAELESDSGEHVDSDSNDICDVCGYIADHTHSYEDTWSWNEATHYHKSACGHNVKADEAKHADENNDAICDVCTYDYDHTHTYDEAWVSNGESGHWHAPTCGHSIAGSELTPHADENNDGACDVCGENGGHEHTYAEAWTTTEDEHWHDVTCGHDIPVSDKGVHKDENGDTTCDICGYTPPHFHTFEEGWTSDGNGHWRKASCGHDVREDEAPHSGHEEDGVCDVCSHVVFRLYTVTVIVPEYVKAYAPDGSETVTFTVKENTPVSFTLLVPDYAEIVEISGAKQDGKPTQDGEYNLYTVKLEGLTANATVSVTGNKISAVEVIIPDGQGTITISQMINYGEITFTVPSAGRYIIFSTDHEDVGIGEYDEEGNLVYSKTYFIDVSEPKEVSLITEYFSFDYSSMDSLDFKYVVAKVDNEITLHSLKADGYTLPTNVDVTVYFTAPKAGRYQVSSSTLGMAWNDYICDSIVLTATEDNQKMSFTVRYENTSTPSFNFDCSIVSMEAAPLEMGDNTVTAPYGSYYAVSVTADQAGSYMVMTQNSYINFYTWNEATATMRSQGTTFTKENMKKGENFTLYITVDIYDYDGTDDVTDILTVSYLGYVPSQSGNGYAAMVDTPNSYINEYEASDFILSVDGGDQISIDGGQTWHTTIQVSVQAGGSITYLVQSASSSDIVTVRVERIAYEFTLQVGTQSQSMIPDKEYTVHLSGSADPAHYVSYILSWDIPNLSVSYNGQLISSGSTISNYTDYYTLILVYDGDEAAEVEFTLTDPYTESGSDTPSNSATLNLGYNAVTVTVENNYCEGIVVTFTAPATGTYLLSAIAGETNAEVSLFGESMSESLTLPYTFTAEKGEVVILLVATTAYMTLDEDIIDLNLERIPTGEINNAAINGTYKVNFIMEGMYTLTFADGTLTVNDKNTGNVTGTYSYYYTAFDGVVVTNTNGTACDIVITIDADMNMTFKCSGLAVAQSLIPG